MAAGGPLKQHLRMRWPAFLDQESPELAAGGQGGIAPPHAVACQGETRACDQAKGAMLDRGCAPGGDAVQDRLRVARPHVPPDAAVHLCASRMP